MNQKKTAFRNTFIVLFFVFFAIAMLGGLFWANLRYVQGSPTSLEFLPIWKGANNLLVEGLTPYGEFTTYEIQKMAYGRAAGPGEPPLRVSLPLPLLLLFLPLGAFADMELARAAWMLILEISLVLLLIFSVRLAQSQLKWFELLFLFLFGFLCFFSVQALRSASPALLLAMLLFGSLLAQQASFEELAGMLLAFSFFSLEMGGLLLLFLLVWAALNRRWRIWAGLLMTLSILGAIAFIINPDWAISFLMSALVNGRANLDPSTFSLFSGWFPGLGQRIAWGLAFLVLLLLMVESQQAFRRSSLQGFWLASLVAAVTPLVGLPVKAGGLVFLLPAFLLSAVVLVQRWPASGRWVALALLSLILGLSWLFDAYLVESSFLWMSLLAVFTLYWVRWWVVRPSRLWADRVSPRRDGHVSY